MDRAKQIVKAISSIHRPDGSPNVFLFSTPRSGSTWLKELIWSQPGFKDVDEPLNLRNPLVRRYLGIEDWQHLYSPDATPKLQRYFQGFCDGRLHFMNRNPFRSRYYRPVTHRIVFKVIHGGEDRINWYRDTFNGRVVYLLRHPIAVSLSRRIYPRLRALLTSDYRRHFDDDQLAYAERTLDSGTKLEHGVLSWCLQNVCSLRDAADDWLLLSYEQMLLDPQPIIDRLADRLELPRPDRMRRGLGEPSAVTDQSDARTRRVLREEPSRRQWLVEKWRDQVGETEERRLMDVLRVFHLDVYQGGDVLPTDRLWVGSRASQNLLKNQHAR